MDQLLNSIRGRVQPLANKVGSEFGSAANKLGNILKPKVANAQAINDWKFMSPDYARSQSGYSYYPLASGSGHPLAGGHSSTGIPYEVSEAKKDDTHYPLQIFTNSRDLSNDNYGKDRFASSPELSDILKSAKKQVGGNRDYTFTYMDDRFPYRANNWVEKDPIGSRPPEWSSAHFPTGTAPGGGEDQTYNTQPSSGLKNVKNMLAQKLTNAGSAIGNTIGNYARNIFPKTQAQSQTLAQQYEPIMRAPGYFSPQPYSIENESTSEAGYPVPPNWKSLGWTRKLINHPPTEPEPYFFGDSSRFIGNVGMQQPEGYGKYQWSVPTGSYPTSPDGCWGYTNGVWGPKPGACN